MKFTETSYSNHVEILKFPNHHIQMAVTVDDTGIVTNADGKKIVPAGTVVGGGVLSDDTKKVSKKNTQGAAAGAAGAGVDAEGVLLYDVDVTYGPAAGAMVLHGFIKIGAMPEIPCADAKAALDQISFIK